ncbi:hypothetical protein [Chryseobacterium sp.]|uniref:hypothetical protein n=1 Tax=Chryseobacterium sp. TaxID=1871047 RepID=UPI001623B019|nr:hypothetical protein [Chryseobacterium sp.]
MKQILLLLLILFSSDALACTCVRSSREGAIINSDVIISGKILSERTIRVKTEAYPQNRSSLVKKYSVLVTEKFKGTLRKRKILLYGSLGNCAYNFRVGENYLIYMIYRERHTNESSKVKKFLYANKCMRPSLIENDEIEKVRTLCIGKGYN